MDLFSLKGKIAVVIGAASVIGEAIAESFVTGSVLFVDGGSTAADGLFMPPGM